MTLTYSDFNLASSSLVYRDFQLFMKRLRRALGPVRFYMAGEYGDQFQRPHFHALLFGAHFADRKFLRKLPSGASIYTSALLEQLWPHGFSSVGDVTFESAAYVARYVMKKITGGGADEHYQLMHPDTGELVQRRPEFNRMSLKPGIGAKWFERYRSEVFGRQGDLDRVVINGVEMKPPKYYDKLLKRVDGFAQDHVAFMREKEAAGLGDDRTRERLEVRERVTVARLSYKKRSLK